MWDGVARTQPFDHFWGEADSLEHLTLTRMAIRWDSAVLVTIPFQAVLLRLARCNCHAVLNSQYKSCSLYDKHLNRAPSIRFLYFGLGAILEDSALAVGHATITSPMSATDLVNVHYKAHACLGGVGERNRMYRTSYIPKRKDVVAFHPQSQVG